MTVPKRFLFVFALLSIHTIGMVWSGFEAGYATARRHYRGAIDNALHEVQAMSREMREMQEDQRRSDAGTR